MPVRPRITLSKTRMLAVTLALISPAFALDPSRVLTQYIHRIWQVTQGLPQASISSITQSHDGYLWLGTQTGLVRFDGVRFTTIEDRSQPLLKNAWVEGLVEDSKQNLWIGTDAGLFRLHDGAVKRFSLADGMPSNNVQCLVNGRDGDLWACTSQGLARVTDDKVVAYGAAQGFPSDAIQSACVSSDGKLWLAGEKSRLNIWDGSTLQTRPLKSLPEFGGVRALSCSATGAVWVGTTNGLLRIENGVERLFTAKDGLADNNVLTLSESRDGSLWIGTKNGFSRLRAGDFSSFQTKDGLTQSSVFALFEDREGNLWAGTKHGLNQFLEGRAVPFTASEGLPSNNAGPVFEDREKGIWVGTLDAGLGRFDGRRFSVLTKKDGLASNSIYALASSSNGDLWVGTGGGLNLLRGGRVVETYTSAQGLPPGDVRCLFRDDSGVMWIGTSTSLVSLRDGRLAPGPRVPILALGEDRDHRILAATGDGSLGLVEGALIKEFTPGGAPVRDVDALYRDSEGLLWIGGVGSGLRLLKDGRIFQYYIKDGLFDDEIYGFAEDHFNRLWMACSRGIFSVDRKDLLRFAAGEIRSFLSNPYSPTDGLRTIECKPGVQPAVWQMSDGDLWFSTIRGLLVIDPKRLQRNLQPPEVVIEGVTVNGQREQPADIEKMPPGRKNLEFRYTGLAFFLPARLTFSYMLEGFDKGWIDAGTRREADYTNLPPSKYRFRVQACNIDGTCNEAGSAVDFVLAPHFYQRPWFIPLAIVLAGLAAWLAYQRRVQRLKQRFGIILAERARIARELHDTLIQGFSGVTMEMQALANRLAGREDRSTLNEIIGDAGTCLKEARRSVAGLRSTGSAGSGLSGAIEQSARQLTEAADVRLRLRLDRAPEGLAAEVEYNLLRIAQEALSNSVKHSGAHTIEVVLNTADGVRLSVKDDGTGFPPGSEDSGEPGHYGLIGMKERAAHIGAEFEIESQPGRGTKVCVTVPALALRNGSNGEDS